MVDRNPKSYTGRKFATTLQSGDTQFNSDFTITNGVVSFGATKVSKTFPTDSGTATPASSAVTFAGGTGLDSSASGATVTYAINEEFLQSAEVTVTAAEVKALAATQKELVAAPGAGKVVVFEKALLKLNYGSEVFTEAGDNLAIKYTDDTGVAVSDTIESTGFIDQSADTYTVGIPVKDAIVAATGAENQALVLDNTGSEIAGNASNDSTLTIKVWYRIATI